MSSRNFKFRTHIEILGRRVGPGEPVLFIAEAGVAHFGSLDKAFRLVDLAVEAGADVFKTQAFHTDTLIASSLPEWRDRLRGKEVGLDFLMRVKERCDQLGIPFMCTAHDATVLPWLEELSVPAFKVGSGERGNLPYLKALAAVGKPVILSTGMYSQRDVQAAVDTFGAAGCDQLALLHCVTSYPTPYPQLGLRAIQTLQGMFPGPVGYSDHTDGHHALVGAVALGACILEKHICLDFNVPNAQDWRVSAGPHNLTEVIRHVREVEAALADSGELTVKPCEAAAEQWAVKHLVMVDTLPAGSLLTAERLTAKRTSSGISPAELDKVLGRRLLRTLVRDETLTWNDIEPPTTKLLP
jgi:N,N'-diacetyllegionaminate synthase